MIEHTDIPANLQTDFLTETVSDSEPVIRREGAMLIFPAFVRAVGGVFRCFEVPCAYTGQNMTDYAVCAIAGYADLRRHFYGPAAVQLEQQLKGTFTAHQYAVRAAFPKSAGEIQAAVARFEAIRNNFWDLVDAACAAAGKSRVELPEIFNAEDMMTLAAENGMSAADVAEYTVKFSIVSLNLLQNGRNWSELFE
ncbi:MAG: hypothetical protein AB7F40_07855 [Victivallaceae bacterium]|nr:hypothetical protein [Victivallaceae bacterium]